MELFDKEEVYDSEISPLMKQVIAICKEHDIPMLASFIYENDEESGIGDCSTLLNPKGPRHHQNLTNGLTEVRRSEHSTAAITITS